jgi:hypothetical protein
LPNEIKSPSSAVTGRRLWHFCYTRLIFTTTTQPATKSSDLDAERSGLWCRSQTQGRRYAKKGADRLLQRPLYVADSDHRERQMTYLSNVASERPMLRISATIILAFICAAPLVLLFSGLVVYGVRSLIHWKAVRPSDEPPNSARFLNSTSAVALQTTNAAHGNCRMRERQYDRYGKHRCHRSNQSYRP